ncbi:MAG: nucleotidyltransferase family protein [Pseudomonadota bacterium]
MPDTAEDLVLTCIRNSPWHMQTLRAVRDVGLPDWAIGAGFVRNAVWDRLHGHATLTPLADVDGLFFDPEETDRSRELLVEKELGSALPDRPWSVRNQARMHSRNGDAPYASTLDAMRFWLETPTCVAVCLETDDRLRLLAPYGLEDLVTMRGRPTPTGIRKAGTYRARMREKDWPATWPKVVVFGPDDSEVMRARRDA